jgi:hypothetical protein
VNGSPHEIVGVLPERFLFLSPEVRLLIPTAFTEEDKSDDSLRAASIHPVQAIRGD